MTASLNARNVVAALIVAGLLLLPLYAQLSGNMFVLTLLTRIVIFALAAFPPWSLMFLLGTEIGVMHSRGGTSAGGGRGSSGGSGGVGAAGGLATAPMLAGGKPGQRL